MSKPMIVEQFLKDVSTHSMQVLLDQGVYRHIKFRGEKDSWNMWFEVITWPNGLTINGDMGCWSFSRVEDMFGFFRREGALTINPSYWSEKITSESRFGGPSEKFDPETYKRNVLLHLEGYDLDAVSKVALICELEDEVFGEEDETTTRRLLADFKYYPPHPAERFRFTDPWEISGKAYTYHYLWCLYAIVWAIQKYDTKPTVERTNPEVFPEVGDTSKEGTK